MRTNGTCQGLTARGGLATCPSKQLYCVLVPKQMAAQQDLARDFRDSVAPRMCLPLFCVAARGRGRVLMQSSKRYH